MRTPVETLVHMVERVVAKLQYIFQRVLARVRRSQYQADQKRMRAQMYGGTHDRQIMIIRAVGGTDQIGSFKSGERIGKSRAVSTVQLLQVVAGK